MLTITLVKKTKIQNVRLRQNMMEVHVTREPHLLSHVTVIRDHRAETEPHI